MILASWYCLSSLMIFLYIVFSLCVFFDLFAFGFVELVPLTDLCFLLTWSRALFSWLIYGSVWSFYSTIVSLRSPKISCIFVSWEFSLYWSFSEYYRNWFASFLCIFACMVSRNLCSYPPVRILTLVECRRCLWALAIAVSGWESGMYDASSMKFG